MKHTDVTRTDAEITRDVQHKMKDDFEVPEDRLRVRVADGFVTIEGTVTRDSERDAAEQCAKRAPGVRGVTNNITVEPTEAPLEAR